MLVDLERDVDKEEPGVLELHLELVDGDDARRRMTKALSTFSMVPSGNSPGREQVANSRGNGVRRLAHGGAAGESENASVQRKG